MLTVPTVQEFSQEIEKQLFAYFGIQYHGGRRDLQGSLVKYSALYALEELNVFRSDEMLEEQRGHIIRTLNNELRANIAARKNLSVREEGKSISTLVGEFDAAELSPEQIQEVFEILDTALQKRCVHQQEVKKPLWSGRAAGSSAVQNR